MNKNNLKVVHPSKITGKSIRAVYDLENGFTRYAASGKVPGKGYMPSFYVKFGDREILVLDNYGNDWLSPEIEERLFGRDRNSEGGGYTAGIDTKSGEIFMIVFYSGGGIKTGLSIGFYPIVADPTDPIHLFVPKRYLRLLPNLKTAKRPWCIQFRHQGWLAFWDREIGWSEFFKSMVVELDIFPEGKQGGRFLEVTRDMSRVAADWI